MILIKREAYLKFCEECGRHAHYVYSDGSRSVDFCSKEVGFNYLKLDLAGGCLSEEEAKRLKAEVESARLVRHREDLDLALRVAFLKHEDGCPLRSIVGEA